MADIAIDGAPNSPKLTGKLYVQNGRLRADWGYFADVFVLNQRKGWRIDSETKTYEERGDKDLSTYAPEMTNGSLCPHTEVPSACKLMGQDSLDGRSAKKWDVWNPKGFHVYYWTDEKSQITLRCEIGSVTYVAKNLRDASIADAMFELPSGYQKVERRWKP